MANKARDLEPPDARVRQLVTPEGIDLRVVLADASQRATAFLIDGAIIIGVLLVVSLIFGFAVLGTKSEIAQELLSVVWMLVFFLLRNLYFMAFEMGARAATPGKRMLGLRVATRNGGRLTADAVFARNALREIEVYLPVTFLLRDASGLDAWTSLAGIVWCGVFVLMPLFNRDRLRAGDLVAGTWVVHVPKSRLSRDLVDAHRVQPGRFNFNQAQLQAYGVKELQVLEGVLRRNTGATVVAVADRIRLKIAWTRSDAESDFEFLDAYYAALRRHLEGRLMFGRRRKDKYDVG